MILKFWNADGSEQDVKKDLSITPMVGDVMFFNGKIYMVNSKGFDIDHDIIKIHLNEMERHTDSKVIDAARQFKDFTIDEKALYFEALHKEYSKEDLGLEEEIKRVCHSQKHTLNGKWMMYSIGQRF